jgi:hypothetical protein
MLRILAANTVHVSYITENCLRRRNRLERARASYDKREQFRLRESCIGRNGNVGRAYTYNATLGDAIHPWAVISLLLLAPLPPPPSPCNDGHECSHSQVLLISVPRLGNKAS